MTPDLIRPAMRALADVLDAAGGVHFTTVTDDGETRIHATTARGRCCSGPDLADVLLELAGRPRMQVCPRCPERGAQPITQFARNEGREEGRNRYCRTCERNRLRKYKARRRAGHRVV
jgi:hypothetical protein